MIAWARFFLLIAAASLWYASAFAQIGGPVAGPANTAPTITATTKFLAPDGTASAPSYSFASAANLGLIKDASGWLGVVQGGVENAAFTGTNMYLRNDGAIGWTASGLPASPDLTVVRDAANTLAQKNGSNAQEFRVYGTTTGPKYLSFKHDGSNGFIDVNSGGGPLILGTGNASSIVFGSSSHSTGLQLRTIQTTVPTCTTNCGTSPTVAGTDTAGIVTMGSTGVPASGWVVTFNGTWSAAPACIVQSALASMVVGKMPIAVVTSTTTMTVTTNGTAPATSDKYQYHCLGVS